MYVLVTYRESVGPVATGSDISAFLLFWQPAAPFWVAQLSFVSFTPSLPMSLLARTTPVLASTM